MEDNFARYRHIKTKLIYGNKERKRENISFIIPAYKRPILIQRAVNSIINQITTIPFDIIVVDDESKRGTLTEQYFEGLCKVHTNIYYYKNDTNMGLFGNWNRCFEISSSKWCCVLLDDDELEPTYLERTVIAVEKYNLDCIMVGNKIMNIDETEPIPRNFLERKYLNRIGHVKIIDSNYFIFRSALNSSGMMIKRSIVLNLGGYNEDYYPGGDFEFDARVVNSDYKVGLLWEKLCITHTEVSTSMKKECIDKSIYLSFPLLQKVYHENFEYNGFLEYISNVRTFISNESRNLDLSGIQGINYKYNSFLYKLIFRIMFRMNRVIEIIER